MSIKIGGNISDVYNGSFPMQKIYVGSDLVWQKSYYDINFPNSSHFNTDLKKTWLAYNSWRNTSGKCYFQVNGWDINDFSVSGGLSSRFIQGKHGGSSNSDFEGNYISSPYYTYQGKNYTIIEDSSVRNGYFPLTLTFQTYSLRPPGNDDFNHLYFITTVPRSGSRLSTTSSIPQLRVQSINKSDVYLLPNATDQRNVSIGKKDKTGGLFYVNSAGNDKTGGSYTIDRWDRDVVPWKFYSSSNSVSMQNDMNLNSRSGRVVLLANDSGLSNNRRGNTKKYWKGSSNEDLFAHNTQISVTLMAHKDDWTDRDISFVVTKNDNNSDGYDTSQFNFNLIESMQKVNFCLLTESQYVQKVSASQDGVRRFKTSENFSQYPTAGLTKDNSTYVLWKNNTGNPNLSSHAGIPVGVGGGGGSYILEEMSRD